MPQLTLSSPVSDLAGAGPKYTNKLFSLGIETIRDLLFYFPFRWDDFSNLVDITQIKPNEKVTVLGTVNTVANSRSPYRRMAITEALISDDSASIKAIWFNQPYLAQTLKDGETYRFSGKAKLTQKELVLQSPSFETTQREITQTGGLIPVYHVTEGITPKMLRYFLRQVLPVAAELKEYLPKDILRRRKFISFSQAVQKIHFPKTKQDAVAAKNRLGFDELFIFQLNYQLKKAKWQKNKAVSIKKDIGFIKRSLKSLDFQLTNDQKIALWEILNDCARDLPMNRLLEGDVGSGKTIVAALGCLQANNAGYQAAIMAPTEILAKQHFDEISKIAQKMGITTALLTNSMSFIADKKTKASLGAGNTSAKKLSKEELYAKIKKGTVQLVIGTHAVIQKKVQFNNLAIVVVDEQHRFGVKQRAYLLKSTQNAADGLKKTIPHLLSMTATPIPRTLALTVYGDLDISIIKQMPKGRKKIITKVVPPQSRNQAYRFAKEQIKKGRQVFVICPLIEESEVLETKAAQQEYERLSTQIFPDLKIGLLHGRLKGAEKEKIMKKFSDNKLQILVSTSVVEVGVDVPNATVMIIEGSERFGLSQLHQFRGRVGRGRHQSYCFLFTESQSAKAWKRIKYLEKTENGFELAEKDLDLRGPGEFLGRRQSGFSNLTVASLKDKELIKTAREEAEQLVKNDLKLDSAPLLKKRMARFEKEAHFE